MATSSAAAAAGYALFRAADVEPSRDDLNAALAASGLAPVSQRMMSHYRALRQAGTAEYISINKFDVARGSARQRVQTLFVSATPGYDLLPLSHALTDRGLKIMTSADVRSVGAVSTAYRQHIDSTDACLAIIAHDNYDSVVFEAGIAMGLGKPVVLGIDRHFYDVLLDLQWLQRVIFDVGQIEPLVSAIERLAERPPPTARQRSRSKRPLSDLRPFKEAAARANGRDFERVVADLISACGGSVHGAPPTGTRSHDDGFDFAVWASELEPVVPNPLLVEVKLDVSKSGREVLQSVLAYLARAGGAGIALLIYRDGPPSSALLASAFPVLPIRFDELLTELAGRTFAEAVVRRRNAAVHNVP